MVRLVSLLQQSIQEEQLRFYHLTEQLKLAHNSEIKENLSGELYLTQNRMAQLCAKNTKCYEKVKSLLPIFIFGQIQYMSDSFPFRFYNIAICNTQYCRAIL